MDEETKATLESVLAESRRPKTHVKTSARSVFPERPVYHASQPHTGLIQIDVSKTDAVLSVNNAKACIVLRASYTPSGIMHLATYLDRCKWNARDEVYEIHPSLLGELKLWLKHTYKDVHVLGVQKQIAATKFDQLMNKLDKVDKDKIYKLLALRYHPDKGGDKETMTLINLVFKGA